MPLVVTERLQNEATSSTSTDQTGSPSSKSRQSCKKNFCIFCKNLKTNLARHFEMCHAEEPEVKKFLGFKKGSPERCDLIANLRKNGNYSYNQTNKEKPILIRRVEGALRDSLPCPNCKGYYSQKTLSRHYVYCCKDLKDKNASRSVLRSARALTNRIHSAACTQLRDKVLPPMRQDEVLDTVKQDMLLIMLGNYLVPKYREHQEYMIRNKLRFVAKYFLTVKKIESSIDEFQKLFFPQHFDVALEAVKQIGQINNNSSVYNKPSSALTIIHYLKICCNILESHYIREGDDVKERAAKRFFKLLKTDAPGKINKPAHRDLCEIKRKKMMMKKKIIPMSSDIEKFKSYILTNAANIFKKLMLEGFSYMHWQTLAELTLLYISVYNRKRAGEAQRIFVEDFENIQSLRDTALPELLDNLNDSEFREIDCTYKLMIRGKLHRTVPVIIPHYIKKYLTFINDHRNQAGVSDDNPYIFGLPGKMVGQRHRTLETCRLIRKHTSLANLKKPFTIRTTLLRKQFATKTSTLNLQDHQKETIVNFMGHQRNIHDEYYKQQTVVSDLMVKKMLDQGSEITVGEIPKRNEVAKEPVNDRNCFPELEGVTTDLETKQDLASTSNATIHTSPKSRKRCIRRFHYSPSSEPFSESGDEWHPHDVRNSPTPSESSGEDCVEKPHASMKQRRTWSTPEKSTARKLFKDYIEKLQVPSLAQCESTITNSKLSKTRTAKQTRQWVDHYIKTNYIKCDSVRVRRPWSSPEKRIIRTAFGHLIKQHLYPSACEINELVQQHPTLKRRSIPSIKSFLQHERLKCNRNS